MAIDLAQRTMNFDRSYFCAFKNFITDRTSLLAGAERRASNLKSCNDATARTLKVPLVHASYDVITVSGTRSRFTQ